MAALPVRMIVVVYYLIDEYALTGGQRYLDIHLKLLLLGVLYCCRYTLES